MENAIYGHASAAAGSDAVCASKRLFGRVAAWRLEGARGKIAGLSVRRSHPATFPVVCAVGMALLWAHLNGYLHVPVSVCDWVRVGK